MRHETRDPLKCIERDSECTKPGCWTPPRPALMVVKAIVSTYTGVNATCLQSSPEHR